MNARLGTMPDVQTAQDETQADQYHPPRSHTAIETTMRFGRSDCDAPLRRLLRSWMRSGGETSAIFDPDGGPVPKHPVPAMVH